MPFQLKSAVLSWLLCAWLLAPPAQADSLEAFHAALSEAYRPMRAAAFYLRTGNPSPASLELDRALARWTALTMAFEEAPPQAYSRDSAWRETLADIAEHLEAGQAALEAGDLEQAGESLGPLRAMLSGLRRRNGVRVFSDCIDKITMGMDALWVYRHAPPDFAAPNQVAAVRKDAVALTAQVQRCDAEATAAVRADPQFRSQIDGMLAALARIDTALDKGDELLLINTLRELRAFDRMLWLGFG